MKAAFVDIGELGWSLYLSAYARWLKTRGLLMPLVVTLEDRKCLFERWAGEIRTPPADFFSKFGHFPASCFGLSDVEPIKLRTYFNRILWPDFIVTREMRFGCRPFWPNGYVGRLLFAPYPNEKKLKRGREILVFPRWRAEMGRNLPEFFYAGLIEQLCDEFKDCTIRTIGTKAGAYKISGISKENYKDSVGSSGTIQDLIDRCQIAKATVGSQSAPPKIALLQGVPTFMIGHQEKRHMLNENWMKTKAGFFKVSRLNYENFDYKACIKKVIEFIKGCK